MSNWDKKLNENKNCWGLMISSDEQHQSVNTHRVVKMANNRELNLQDSQIPNVDLQSINYIFNYQNQGSASSFLSSPSTVQIQIPRNQTYGLSLSMNCLEFNITNSNSATVLVNSLGWLNNLRFQSSGGKIIQTI